MAVRYTLGASVSCFDLFNLERQFAEIHDAPVDFLHYDVVDGDFNNCIILGLPLLEAIRPHTKLPVDVHLAVYRPQRFIEQFARAGADIITIHAEGTGDAAGCFDLIRSCGAAPALALRSETEADKKLLPLLEQALFVTKLTVNPGFAGQTLQNAALTKMKALRKLMDSNGIAVPIAADGSVNPATIPALAEAGASMLIGGSSGLFLPGKTVQKNARAMLTALESQRA
jgi:ribulose-phosphate 3-epimerase